MIEKLLNYLSVTTLASPQFKTVGSKIATSVVGPKRWRVAVNFVPLYFVIGGILRLILWANFGSRSGVGFHDLPLILLEGVRADLRVLVWVLAPLSLYLWLAPQWLYRWKVARLASWVVTYFTIFGLIYLSCVEYFFFEEFDSRFNLVAVDYLIYPHEVLVNIWDSYPVLPTLIVTSVLAGVLLLAMRNPLRDALSSVHSFRHRSIWAVGHLSLIFVILVGPFFAVSPVSTNRSANQMAFNGLASFFEALQTHELDYYAHYQTGNPKILHQRLSSVFETNGAEMLTPKNYDLNRRISPPSGSTPKSPNIVVIVEESFGAEFVGAYGSTKGLTPSFDALSHQGLLFRNAFATGTRTVRGLEAIAASFPPIPSESIVKRPGGDHVANWGGVMKGLGYHASFLYGGYGYFDNMNQFFSGNGFEIKDRTDIEDQTFTNIWGVCDEDLFRFAVDYFDERQRLGQPFFSIVLSTSNHKPYTFPPGIPEVPTQGGGREAGIRYADYSLGRFFEMATDRSWFENTLFVVVADHGARVYGKAQIPLHSYEIPLLMIWPGNIEPGFTNRKISQMDIAPTVLGFLDQPYEAPFFGQDALSRPENQRPVLLVNHNHDVGALRDDELVVLGLKKSVRSYRYDRGTVELKEIKATQELVELTTAYYQTAFDLFRDGDYR